MSSDDNEEIRARQEAHNLFASMAAAQTAGTAKQQAAQAWAQWVSAKLNVKASTQEAVDEADRILEAYNQRFSADDAIAAALAVGRKI